MSRDRHPAGRHLTVVKDTQAVAERECGSIHHAGSDPRLAGVVMVRTLYRSRERRTIRLHLADRVCVALGQHPLAVFGDAYYADLVT